MEHTQQCSNTRLTSTQLPPTPSRDREPSPLAASAGAVVKSLVSPSAGTPIRGRWRAAGKLRGAFARLLQTAPCSEKSSSFGPPAGVPVAVVPAAGAGADSGAATAAEAVGRRRGASSEECPTPITAPYHAANATIARWLSVCRRRSPDVHRRRRDEHHERRGRGRSRDRDGDHPRREREHWDRDQRAMAPPPPRAPGPCFKASRRKAVLAGCTLRGDVLVFMHGPVCST